MKIKEILQNRILLISELIKALTTLPAIIIFSFLVLTINVNAQTTIWSDDFETDKGWTLTGEWERGAPTASGGEHGNPDPASAQQGTNVLGTDLSGLGANPGDYEASLANRAYTATSPVIDCGIYTGVHLKFQRWLNVESSSYDHAYIDVYANGSWNLAVWQNTALIEDGAWSLQDIDISAIADGFSDVRIRFCIGTTDGSWFYSGWNIDDFETTGTSSVSPPVADFSATPTSVYEGGTVSFTDLSTNSPTSWAWTFPGGTPATSTAQNPSVVYSTAGTYNVQLIATNAGGSDTELKTLYITVTVPPPPLDDLVFIKGDFDVKSTASVYIKGGLIGEGSGQTTNNGYIYIQQNSEATIENWTNDASAGFLDGTGTVTFNSGRLQHIQGTQETSFYNLTIDNSGPGVIMEQNADVLYNLTMTDGDLDLQNSIVDLTTTGTIITEAETNRIKVGDVMNNTGTIQTTKTINSVANYNPANIGVEITTDQNLGLITIVRGHQRQQGTGTYTANYSIARFVDIPGIGELDGSNVNLKMYYWDAELDPADHPIEANLIEFHSVTQSGNTWWTPLAGAINTGTNLATPTNNPYGAYIYGAAYSAIVFNDRLTLSSDETPLPVELLNFNAKWKDNTYTNVEIEWQTASEINNDYFVVERSEDAQNFTPLLNVDGNGNFNQTISYLEYDNAPYKKIVSYYRLKQVDFNGNYTYSDIRSVYPPVDFIEIISVYPNPADKEITFEIISTQDTKVNIYIIDNLGRKTIHKKTNIYKDSNIVKIDISNLCNATYLLCIITESGMHKTQKEFIKR